MRTPDPQRSYAVLIGTSDYRSPRLPDLPPVRENLTGLKQVLTDPKLGGLPVERCVELLDESDFRAVYRALRQYAAEAEDTLIVYFAGHGRVGHGNDLYLGLADTDPDELEISALSYDLVRKVFAECRATNRVLILDCCFSGLAVRDMSADTPSALVVDSTYILTATPPTALALAPLGATYTAFTGALLALLRDGVPGGPEFLTFGTLYPQLLHIMTEQRLPRPQQRGTGLVNQLALTRNAAYTDQGAAPPTTPVPVSSAKRRPLTIAALVAGVLGLVIAVVVYLTTRNAQTASGPTADESSDCPTGTANGAGSTIQREAMERWTIDYHRQCASVRVNYNVTGSGAGYQEFIDGAVDFAGYDGPLSDDDRAKVSCQKLIVPILARPIAIIYRLDGINNLQLRPDTLAKIFSGAITRWDAAEIEQDNPNVPLPPMSITPVHRTDATITTAAFTDYLKQTSEAWDHGVNKAWTATVGTGAVESYGMTSTVAATAGAIGYVEWQYASNFPVAKLGRADSGEFTELSAIAATKAIEQFKVSGTGDDLTVNVDPALKDPATYPLVMVSHEIVCVDTKRASARSTLKGFLGYITSPAVQVKLSELGYAPLPKGLGDKVTTKIRDLA